MLFALMLISLLVAAFVLKTVYDLSSAPRSDKDFYPHVRNHAGPTAESSLPFVQMGGTLNDASAVNRTPVYGVVGIRTEEDIRAALQYAAQNHIKVSISGARHSMGGQAFAKNSLNLDMRGYNKATVNRERGTITVQSGATWHDVQRHLSPYHLSVLAMQSIDVPTVGGTIAVNAHGMDHRVGGIASTIRSMRLMLADATVLKLSRSANHELFRAVVGGYGFLGVILDVELELMDDLFYAARQKVISTDRFAQEFKSIKADGDIHMFYARLSTAPASFLQQMLVYTFRVTEPPKEPRQPLTSESYIGLRRFVFNLGRKNHAGREIKWWSEKYIQPLVEPVVASRNKIMHRSYAYLKNNLRNNSDVLQEFFLPPDGLQPFISQLGPALQKHQVICRNVEIRCVHKENILLDYAQGDWFGVVLYLNFDVPELDAIKKVHHELINTAQSLGGSFYLPYLLSASKNQVQKSYPGFDALLKLKREYDPSELFVSEFYNRYK